MSTALVSSAFYDVGDVLYQNHKNCLMQTRTVMPTTERRILGSNASLRMAPSSPDSGHSSPVLCSREVLRKLDRSMSEPAVERKLLPSQQQPQSQASVNSSRYKTELCRPFEENGHCKYGDKCQFAHGGHELRSLSRHPKYKTELCRTFHTIGFCPYGPRCHFIHNEDLRRLTQINQQKQAQQSPPAGSLYTQSAFPPQSQPTAITRPKALSFNFTLPLIRDSLGSCADSPPASITDSPTMSPTFVEEYLSMQPTFSPPPPASAPVTSMQAPHFTFPGEEQLLLAQTPTMMAPLNVQTEPGLMNLANSLHALSLREQLAHNQPRETLDNLHHCAPSPPESDSGDSGVSSVASTCGSPLEVSRGLRLPIFSQLSCSE